MTTDENDKELLESVFEEFSKTLAERMKERVYTTEDSIRYLLFDKFIKGFKISTNACVLEYPYGEGISSIAFSNNRELDALFETEDFYYAVEVKFHRGSGEGSSDFPKTSSAGSLFNDIIRLSLIHSNLVNDIIRLSSIHSNLEIEDRTTKPVKKLFLYVTDGIMNKYLCGGKRPGFVRNFYNGNPVSIPKKNEDIMEEGVPATFQKEARKSFPANFVFSGCMITNVFKKDLDEVNYHIRAYTVENL